MYGPDVAHLFARAQSSRDERASRPVTLQVTPTPSTLVVDCVPVVDRARPRYLRNVPGFGYRLAP